MHSANKLIKPFLKWAGGKRQLLPLITENYLPEQYNTYYEPFIGGGAMFFMLQPKKAVINDTNKDLINCYTVIKDSLYELIEELKRHENEKNYYYAIRGWDRNKDYHTKSPIQQAARIIYLNKACYNGLFRVNCKGQFNVPFGNYKNPKFFDTESFQAISEYLNNNKIKILNLDFKDALKDAQKDDFIYLDPPYDTLDKSSFTKYNSNGFSKDDQIRVKNVFEELDSRGCKVLLSNAYTDFILELYRDYNQTKVSAIRSINSNIYKRGKINEILVKNY